MPAAVDERQVGTDLVTGDAAAIDALLLDKGFNGSRSAAEMAAGQIFEGLLTRTVATLAAHTLLMTLLAETI